MATFYIEALESTTITLSKVGSPTVGEAMYGINDTSAPNSYTYGDSIDLTAGQKCYWTITSTTTDFSTSNYLNFTSTGEINTGGNLSDLIGGQTSIPKDYCFYGLFYGCTKLVNASNLIVVTNFNSKACCYHYMFYGCTSLTSTPQLPTTVLTTACYQGMFYGCTSLASLPQLPDTRLASGCYDSMFYGCTNIKLSATRTGVYQIPYRIPSSSPGSVTSTALNNMFTNTGGTFRGTPLINITYYIASSFYIEAIENTTITLSMVGSPTVGTATYIINDTANSYTYGDGINLTAGQKCYFTITSTTTAFSTSKYLKFTSTGRINTGGNLSDLIGGETAIPRNYCFCHLFYNCTTLVDASNLVMVNNFNSKTYCYYGMFYRCTSLTTPPALPATTLTDSCYRYMFYGCTSLMTVPELPATTLADSCYRYMFYGCTNIQLSATQTGPYQTPYRIPSYGAGTVGSSSLTNMFMGTGGLTPITPTINTTYYLYSNNIIYYNTDILAGFNRGGKILCCAGKLMKDDITVVSKTPVDIIYNNEKISSEVVGEQVVLCKNKYMQSNITVKCSDSV